MPFRHLIRDAFAGKALPAVAEFSQESSTLVEKLAIQIKWMQKKGIDISLKESERPRLAQKPVLPGTVIYFSSVP
jgi:hypothetical protein